MCAICVSLYFNTINYIRIYESIIKVFKVFSSKKVRVLLMMPIDFKIMFLVNLM